MTLGEQLGAEMSAFWERIQAQKSEAPEVSGIPQPFQVTQTIVKLEATEQPPPADVVDVNNYAGDPVPNPDATGL